MHATEAILQPTAGIDSWNQERTLEQLQAFVQTKLSGNAEEVSVE